MNQLNIKYDAKKIFCFKSLQIHSQLPECSKLIQLFSCQRPIVFMNGLMLGAICQVLNNKQKMHQLSELESDRQERCHLLLGLREMREKLV